MPAYVVPEFQAQNPAINGYSLGWQSCTAYSGAMVASFERQAKRYTTGEIVRRRTGDTSGGTNLAQIDAALKGLGVDLDVTYGLSWEAFAKKVQAGCGAILQGWYAPIADSRFDAGNGFRGNHAVAVLPGWLVQDPLADGRRAGTYDYHGESYPPYLLRQFAGRLNLSATGGYRPLGDGKVYAAFTHDKVHTFRLDIDGGEWFFVYKIGPNGQIVPGSKGRTRTAFRGDTSTPCGVPQRRTWDTTPGVAGGVVTRQVAMVTASTSRLYGQWVGVPQGAVHLDANP